MNEKISRQQRIASEARARAFEAGADLVTAVSAGRTAAALARAGLNAEAAVKEAVYSVTTKPAAPQPRKSTKRFDYVELALAFASGVLVCAAIMGVQI